MVEKRILKMKFFKTIKYWNIWIFVWKKGSFNLAFVNLNELKMNWTRLKNMSHDHSRSWTKNQQKYEPDSWTELNWTEMIGDLVHFFLSLYFWRVTYHHCTSSSLYVQCSWRTKVPAKFILGHFKCIIFDPYI